MSAEAPREAAFTKAQRCPYCHESIAVDEDAWIACAQCLGRHHQSCWDESGSCSSCSHTHGLPNQALVQAPLDLAPLTEEVSASVDLGPADGPTPEDHWRETARVFQDDGVANQAVSAVPLTPLTLGILPQLQAERALTEHRRRNHRRLETEPLPADLPQDLREQVEAARDRCSPTQDGLDGTLRRVGLPLVTAVGWLGVFVTLLIGRGAWYPPDAALISQVLFALASAAAVGMHTWVHSYRRAVRNHERDQLFVRLIGRAVPAAASKDLLTRLSSRWNGQAILLWVCTLLTLGLLVFDLVNARSSGEIRGGTTFLALLVSTLVMPLGFAALRQHVRHEEDAQETLDLYERQSKTGGDAPSPPG